MQAGRDEEPERVIYEGEPASRAQRASSARPAPVDAGLVPLPSKPARKSASKTPAGKASRIFQLLATAERILAGTDATGPQATDFRDEARSPSPRTLKRLRAATRASSRLLACNPSPPSRAPRRANGLTIAGGVLLGTAALAALAISPVQAAPVWWGVVRSWGRNQGASTTRVIARWPPAEISSPTVYCQLILLSGQDKEQYAIRYRKPRRA